MPELDIEKLVARIADEVGCATTFTWSWETDRTDFQVLEALATHTDSGTVREAAEIIQAAVRRGVEAYLAGPPTPPDDSLRIDIGAELPEG